MTNENFKIGDVVRVKNSYTWKRFRGLTGVVVCESQFSQIGVHLKDIDFTTHTCSDLISEPKGWWFFPNELEIVKPAKTIKIITYIQDNKVIAKMICADGTSISAQAKCSPDDNFNFLTGAQIALQRLVKKNKDKYVIPKDLLVNVKIE